MIVDQVVLPLHPDIVFVFFGANDAVDKSVGQHVPLNDYASNIRTIITKLRQVLNVNVSRVNLPQVVNAQSMYVLVLRVFQK